MRKIILSLTIVTFALNAKAQISITRADIGNISDKVVYSQLDSYKPTTDLTLKGQNQSWDFTSLINGTEKTTLFDDVKNYSRHQEFPSANLALIFDDKSSYVYYMQDNNDSIYVVGTSDSMADGIHYNQLKFPMEFGKNWNDNTQSIKQMTGLQAGFPTADSAKYIFTAAYNNSVEAEGKVHISNGSIDAIKVLSTIIGKIDFYAKTGNEWKLINSKQKNSLYYSFYAKNNGYAILILSDNFDETFTSRYKQNIIGITAGIEHLKSSKNGINIYPNPTTHYLNIESNKVDTYIITDILGKNLMNGNTTSSIDVSGLAQGNYIIQLFQNEQLISVNKFVIN